MPSPTNAPAPPPALVASAEGEPVTDLDHARYDRDGWMESALRAQGYVGELQGRLAAALARAERAERALAFYADEQNYRMNGPLDPNSGWFEGVSRAQAALAHPALAEET